MNSILVFNILIKVIQQKLLALTIIKSNIISKIVIRLKFLFLRLKSIIKTKNIKINNI